MAFRKANGVRDAQPLSELITAWRSNVVSATQIASLTDQVGRLISWRLQQIHGRGYGWHDLHQQCWLAVVRLFESKIELTPKPSTYICAVVDGVVKREHQAKSFNTWDCTMEAVKRINGEMVEQGIVVIEHTPVKVLPED